jgi:hypothetical protein
MSTPVNEPFLGRCASDARRVAGEAYYTGCRVRADSNTVELYLANAPRQLLDEIEALHPGIYVIHNNAPRTLSELLMLMHSIDLPGLRSQGISVNQIGPRNDGYLWVGVNTDIAAAQTWFEAEYGPGMFRFFTAEPIRMHGARQGHAEPV